MGRFRWFVLGSAASVAAYWLVRYLRPEHSPLVLKQAVVIITGASAGIGRAYALAFARRGARVVLAARRADLLEAVRAEIATYAADVLCVPTDVNDDAQLERLVRTTLERYGRIDILINNAGVVMQGMLHNHDPQRVRAMVNTNLAAAINLTRLCLPSMLAQRSGTILNISSVGGAVPNATTPAYTATKAGLNAFSSALRRQLEGTGVRVVTVLPAYTDTDMLSPVIQDYVRNLGFTVDTPYYVAEHTIDALLKGEQEIWFGGFTTRAVAWLERHVPFLSTLLQRWLITPEVIAMMEEPLVAQKADPQGAQQ
ncbi:MAG: oxidoreductase [Candidatus Thermofonsia Clade 1 bacterium]|jgi:short-subunit dehydrogenase|uniref:Oxidoreductase n=1 Tax=Candidatus Thermofonsia Clade 1 bacterium TaxID=2364210 RepID=A0A2M8PHX0_9CHLR|nr:MAG: oxidoreductase [Candidatus Thermofonsia Clade 1 bacterium]RMF54065.1 MAG: SDR family oxidoreductase [Chloroflexota bacterium]